MAKSKGIGLESLVLGARELEPEARIARALGLAAALLIAAVFNYPSRAFPLQSLILTGFLYIFAVSVALRLVAVKDKSFFGALSHPGVIALGIFAFWSIMRWQRLQVPALDGEGGTVKLTTQGRPTVIAYQWMAVGMLFGLGISFVERANAPIAWPTFRKVMILAAIAFACHGIYQFAHGYDTAREEINNRFGGQRFTNSLMRQSIDFILKEKRIGGNLGTNLFAAWLAILAGFSLSGFSRPASRGMKVISGLAYILAVVALYLTGSRGGMLTLLVVTAWGIALLLTQGGGAVRKPATPAAALAFWLAPVFLLLSRVASADSLLERLGKVSTIRERFTYWQIASRIWAMDWLAGAGPGGYMLYYPRFKPPTARESRYAHSWIFHIGSELGWAGLFLFLAFVMAVAIYAYRSWRASKPGGPHEALAREANWLALAFGALLLNGLFEYTLQTREFLLLLGFLGGALIGIGHRLPMPGFASFAPLALSARVRAVVGGGFAFLAVLSVAWLTPRLQIATFWEGEGRFMMDSRDERKAAEYFRKASNWLGDDESYLVQEAMARYEQPMQFRYSYQLLSEAERMNPLSAAIRARQANLLHDLGRRDEALKKMTEAVELNPNDAGVRLDRANAWLDLKEPEQALEDINYIEENRLPLWEFQQPEYTQLKQRIVVSQENPPTKRNPAYGWGAKPPPSAESH